MGMFSGVLGLIVILFLFVLAVLWFFLPFAIFGTKDKLEALIVESKRTNLELARVVAELVATRAEMSQRRPPQNASGKV